MAEYINKEKLIEAIHKATPFHDGNGDIQYGLHIAENIIKEQPAADVIEVVCCKECIKRYTRDCALWYGTTANNGQVKDYFCGVGTLNEKFSCAYGVKGKAG